MITQSKVQVSTDGPWVHDGYRWWPIWQVPVGTRTAHGYVWSGREWMPPTGYVVPPAPKQGIGIFGGIILAAVVALVIMVSMGMFLPL